MITQLTQIVEEARRRGYRRLAVAYGADTHTLEAVTSACREGIVKADVTGPEQEIKAILANFDVPENTIRIIDCPDAVTSVGKAVSLVASGEADILMKGLVPTDVYMRGILNREAGLVPPKGILSHVSVFEIPTLGRLLCLSDAAVIPLPDLAQKAKIIQYLASTAKSLGIESPRIACIAPSEQLLPSVISSTEAAILAKMSERGQLGDAIVDGPLSLDVALYPEVADEKKVKGSSVAGKADCLLFPNIESGNVFFKAATHFGNAEVAALVAGARVPCVLTSRGDTPASKLFSIALASLQVK